MTAERTREQRCSPVSKKNDSISLCLNDTLWYLDDASACLSEHKQWHRFRTERHIGHIWRVLCTYAATPHESGSDAMLSPLLEGSAGARQQKETQKPHTTTSQCIHSFLFLPHKKSTCRIFFEVETNRATEPFLRSLALRGKIFPTKSAKFGMLECWRRWWYNTTGRFYVVLHLIRSTLNSKTKYSSSECLLSLVLSKKRQLLLTRFCSTWRS